MKGKKRSIKDIAAELNVSVTTVSFVLNGKAKEKRISEEVSKRVLEYCESVNYKPNVLAQSLRTGQSKLLVFMVEDISNYFFAKLVRYFEDLAFKEGYKVLFCSNENSDEKSKELIHLFNQRQVDGYIIVPSPGIEHQVQELQEDGAAVVLFDRYFDSHAMDYVGIDNQQASEIGIEHLLANGFKKPAFIAIDTEQTQMKARLQGYEKAMKKAGIPSKTLLMNYDFMDREMLKPQLRSFFENHPDIDSILFATNYIGKAGLGVLRKMNPKKTDMMGIVTFDDHDLFDITCPTLTAIRQPLGALAEEIMQLMLHKLKHKNEVVAPKKIQLPTELVVRDSSKPYHDREYTN